MTEENVWMPKELTAENGAKGLLSGEFYEIIVTPCADCWECGSSKDCPDCGGTGDIEHRVYVSWGNIKKLYAIIVKNYGNSTR